MSDPKIVKLTGMRGIIARKMQESLSSAAQLTFHADCDATALVSVRNGMKGRGTPVSYEDLMCKAVSTALKEFPEFNGHVVDKEIRISDRHHISVAIAVAQGLVVPTVFDVQDKSLEEISEARRDLIERAKTGALTVLEMTGGTFTISNLGMTRVRYFTPIINSPQIAILGLGQLKGRELAEDYTMGLSLTADHRAVDGYPCGMFLGRLAEVIETLS